MVRHFIFVIFFFFDKFNWKYYNNLFSNLESIIDFISHGFVKILNKNRKTNDTQKKEVPLYKKANLNHTEYAYRDAVNRLKSMLSDSYSAVKQNTRRPGYESDDTDNLSVII